MQPDVITTHGYLFNIRALTRISFHDVRANLHAIRATFSSVILETDQDNTTHQRAVEIYIYFFSSNCLEQSVLVQRPTTFILRSLVYSRKVSGIEFVAVSRTEPGVESTSNDSLALLPLVAHRNVTWFFHRISRLWKQTKLYI